MTIKEAFELYRLDYIIFANQSAKTEENHLVCLKALVNFLGEKDVCELTREDVRDWKLWLDRGRSPSTVRNYIVRLRVVLRYLQKRKYDVLDYESIPVPKRPQTVPTFLTSVEVGLLVNTTRRVKNKAIISFLYASGLRVSELCALNRDQLNNNSFTVTGKGGKARLCFIDRRTRKLLDQYLKTRQDNDPALFLTDGDKRILSATIQETVRTAGKICGLDVHPHTLRHSYATDLMANGAHIYQLQRLMGHANIQTTELYLHVTDPQLEETYNKHHAV